MRGWIILWIAIVCLDPAVYGSWEWWKAAPAGTVAEYLFDIVYDSHRNVFVVYGGCYCNKTNNTTWEWDGQNWTRVFTKSTPKDLCYHGMVYDSSRSKTVLFGGLCLVSSPGYWDETWEYDGNSWEQVITEEHPGPQEVSAMAYDPVREVTVFSGSGETWEYDGTQWVQFFPQNSHGGGMVFDYYRHKIITCLHTVAEWEGGEWNYVATIEEPDSSSYADVASDPVSRTVLRYGDEYVDDTWVWDGESWMQKFPAHPIPQIVFPRLVYHEGRQRIVLYGGSDDDGNTNNMYEWDGEDWHVLEVPARPKAMEYCAMAGNLPGRGAILFGGWDNYPDWYSSQTWEFRSGVWTQLYPEHHPDSRAFHAMGSDWERGVVVLYGGLGYGHPYFETWEYDGVDWEEKRSEHKPSAVDMVEMAYDPVNDVMVLYGGFCGGSTYSDQTWGWDGTEWTRYYPTVVPPGRVAHSMAYDERNGRIVMFGGVSFNPHVRRLNTWEWDGENWTEIVTDGNDPWETFHGTYGFHMMYDYRLERIFCSNVPSGSDYITVNWLWDGTVWTKMWEGDVPGQLEGIACGYDSIGEQSVLFGGYYSHVYGNTWVFDNSGTPPTSNPTRTPSPTRTPTATIVPDTPTVTPEPTMTPVATETPTVEPDPTITPTPQCNTLGIRLEMPEHEFTEGSRCNLLAYLCNPDEAIDNVPVFIILDVLGSYWCAPSWVSLTEGIDSYLFEPLPSGRSKIRVIPDFTWPSGTGSADGLYFHAVLTDPDVTQIIGTSSSWEFGYDEAR